MRGTRLPHRLHGCRRAFRVTAISGSTPTAQVFSGFTPGSNPRRWNNSRRSSSCAPFGMVTPLPAPFVTMPRYPAWTLRRTWSAFGSCLTTIAIRAKFQFFLSARTSWREKGLQNEAHPPRSPRRRKRNPGEFHQGEIRDSPDLHRRHAANGGESRNAPRTRSQEGHGFGRPGFGRNHHRGREGALEGARLRARLFVRRLSAHASAGAG